MGINITTQYLKIPKANPLRLMKSENGLDDYFMNEVPPFEQAVTYAQPFQTSDTINAQIQVNPTYVTDYALYLYDCNDNKKKTATKQTMATLSGWRYVHFNMIPPTSLADGIYYAVMKVTLYTGQTDWYISEPLDIRATHSNTITIDYANNQNDFDMVFNSGAIGSDLSRITTLTARRTSVLYRIRVHGGKWSSGQVPSSDDVIYTNQSWDAQIVSSIPYEVIKWTFGDGRGIPQYLADKINRALAMTNVQINSTAMCKIEGAKLEGAWDNRYPMAAYSIDMMYSDNDYADDYSFNKVLRPTGIGFDTIGFNFLI